MAPPLSPWRVCVKLPQTKPSMLARRLCDDGKHLDIPSDRKSLQRAARKLDATLLWPEGASQGGRHSMQPHVQKLVYD
jgi:hypothetical protein